MIDKIEYTGLTEIIELTEKYLYSEYIDMIGIRDNIDATEITNSPQARKLAAEQGKGDSAPPLAPEAGEPATRQLRQAWSGKTSSPRRSDIGQDAGLRKTRIYRNLIGLS
jgi:hypothetical protein